MQPEQLIIIATLTIGASFVQRVSGFGFGIFIMTMLPYLMPSYGEATTLSGLLASVTSLFVVIKMHRHIVWRKLWTILGAFSVFSFFAVALVSTLDNHLLKKILGVILILVSIYFLFLRSRISLKPSTPVQLSMGSLSGLMGGFFGMQGPPAALYFLAASKNKEEYLALSQIYFFLGNMVMTAFRYGNGLFTLNVGKAFACGILAVGIGAWLGSKVFSLLTQTSLQRIVYAYIGISGIVALAI